ncbi:MAG TPA: hypothetical protein VMW87_01580 [Spirochaetia bacterium]|nr:hypothetical protein [Spirochaetia bacterium]
MPKEAVAPTVPSRSDETIYLDLVNKIRLQRGLHRYYELRTRYVATAIRVVSIVLPAHIVFLVFSDLTSLTSHVKWLTRGVIEITIGAAGFILFVTSLVTEVFKGDRRHLDHRRAIERYSELLQEIELLDFSGRSAKMRAELFDSFHKRYLQITVTSPTFTDKQFESAMTYLVRSKALKLARKENPFASNRQVRKIARSKVPEVLADESDPLYRLPLNPRYEQAPSTEQ